MIRELGALEGEQQGVEQSNDNFKKKKSKEGEETGDAVYVSV